MYQNHLASLSAMASRVLCQSPYPSKVSEQPDWDPVLSCPILGIFPRGVSSLSWTLRLGSELGRDLSRPPMPKPEPEATHWPETFVFSPRVQWGAEVEDSPVNLPLSSLSRWVSHRIRCRGRRRELKVSGPTIGGRGSGGSEQAGVPADTSSPAHKFWELVPAWELSRMEEKVEGHG